MGTTLAKGLVDAATMGNSTNGPSIEILQLLEQTKASLEKSHEIQSRIELNLQQANVIQEKSNQAQDKLLQFLQSKFT